MYEHHGDQMFDTNRDGVLDRREQVLKADYYSRLGNNSSGNHYRKAGGLEYFFYIILMFIGIITLIGIPPLGAIIIVAAKSLIE